jgi:hypothetical protein
MSDEAKEIKPERIKKNRGERGPGKVTAAAKDNVLAVFNRLGGTHAMAKWAKANQTDFYRLYGKLIPQQIDMEITEKPKDVSMEPLPIDQWDERYSAPRLNG